MSKRKFLKPLIFGVTGISLVGLVAGLSINWSHMEYLQSVGSSGVKPFIEAFSTQYHKSHEKLEVVVEAGGTTFAIEQVAKGYAQIGNASNNPYWTIFPESGEKTEYSKQWENKKTITLGWEGVGVIYKVPTDLSKEGKENFDILVTKDNILDLLAVFSGFNESKNADGSTRRWDAAEAKEKNCIYYYLSKASKAYFDAHEEDKEVIQKIAIYPYLRSGGNTAANSSIAFTYYTNLVNYEDLTINQQNAFRGGQYGPDHDFGETDEANSKAWGMLSQQDREGAMTYMTSSFFAPEGNREAMREKGFKVASYLPKDLSDESNAKNLISIDPSTGKYLFSVDDVGVSKQTGYNWFRPINVMIDLNNQKVKDWIWWVFFGNDDHTSDPLDFSETYKNVMKERGANPLYWSQLESMFGSNLGSTYNNFFSPNASDLKLAESRDPSWKKIFGACEWSSNYGK